MSLGFLDISFFVGFICLVIGISLYASRRERDNTDYFLAGRNLSWWLIGFSLIASNISTEHFVGMAGTGYEMGLAIASYEWIAAVTLVFMCLFVLPRFLQLGIFTLPEFLEHRFGSKARTIMAIWMLLGYIGVALAAILYSGAIGLKAIFGLDLIYAIWFIGIIAGAYTTYGGLKAVVWSDLIQGITLLLGGLLVTLIAVSKVGGWGHFMSNHADKMHVVLSASDPQIPWTALLLGIWIPNFFYWGFNQFISQRALGAKNIKEGQWGMLLAAGIKLLIPFIIIVPGIAATEIFVGNLETPDMAYPSLIREILPVGLRGVMLAALFGAIMSSLDSVLNSASTIFTMDIYHRWIRPKANSKKLMSVGRWATAAMVILGCLIAPLPGSFEGVFTYIQLIWGFISPGVVAVFLFGIFSKRTPEQAAVFGLLAGSVIYGLLLLFLPNVPFLNHMAITFVVLSLFIWMWTHFSPLPEPFQFEVNEVEVQDQSNIKLVGLIIVGLTAGLYAWFW